MTGLEPGNSSFTINNSSFFQQQQQLFQQQGMRETQQEASHNVQQQPIYYEEECQDNQSLMSPGGSEVFEQQDEEESDASLAERVVNIIQDFPCLWNVHLRSYKDINKKDQAWKELQTELKVPGTYHFPCGCT